AARHAAVCDVSAGGGVRRAARGCALGQRPDRRVRHAVARAGRGADAVWRGRRAARAQAVPGGRHEHRHARVAARGDRRGERGRVAGRGGGVQPAGPAPARDRQPGHDPVDRGPGAGGELAARAAGRQRAARRPAAGGAEPVGGRQHCGPGARLAVVAGAAAAARARRRADPQPARRRGNARGGGRAGRRRAWRRGAVLLADGRHGVSEEHAAGRRAGLLPARAAGSARAAAPVSRPRALPGRAAAAVCAHCDGRRPAPAVLRDWRCRAAGRAGGGPARGRQPGTGAVAGGRAAGKHAGDAGALPGALPRADAAAGAGAAVSARRDPGHRHGAGAAVCGQLAARQAVCGQLAARQTVRADPRAQQHRRRPGVRVLHGGAALLLLQP
ncbi:hypothetical protein LPJ70_007105, partial [Coemansia sp. RSA 2708]